jgi:hypothetical protein
MVMKRYLKLKAGIHLRDKTQKLKDDFLRTLEEKQVLMLDEINKRNSELQKIYILIIALGVSILSFMFGFYMCKLTYQIIDIVSRLV